MPLNAGHRYILPAYPRRHTTVRNLLFPANVNRIAYSRVLKRTLIRRLSPMVPATFLAMIYVMVGAVNEYNVLSDFTRKNPDKNISPRNRIGIIPTADMRCPFPATQSGSVFFSTQLCRKSVVLYFMTHGDILDHNRSPLEYCQIQNQTNFTHAHTKLQRETIRQNTIKHWGRDKMAILCWRHFKCLRLD